MTPEELLAAWHAQQTAFIEFRELRTRTLIDVLAARAGEAGHPLRILDLGCGPGSLGSAILERMPDSQVVSVDRDPILLRLGRETNRYGDRLVFVDANLTDTGWLEQIPQGPYDAMVSATALHWLQPGELAQVYLDVASVLAPGGIVLNADHLYFREAHHPFLKKVADTQRADFEARAQAGGAMSWDGWWDAAKAQPGWETEVDEWHRRWAEKYTTIKVDPDFHLSALSAAGCVETAQLYQWFDDRIIYGRLP